MTSVPPPGSPYVAGHAPGGPPPSGKRRPSAWWFALGAALLLLAGVVVAFVLGGVLRTFTQTAADFPVDGKPHEISLEADREHYVFTDRTDDVTCEFVETENGQSVDLQSMGSTSVERNDDSALGKIESSSGELTATCRGDIGQASIGPVPSTPGWIGGLAGAIAIPILLGIAGLSVLIITAVLFVSRGRSHTAHYEHRFPPGQYPSN